MTNIEKIAIVLMSLIGLVITFSASVLGGFFIFLFVSIVYPKTYKIWEKNVSFLRQKGAKPIAIIIVFFGGLMVTALTSSSKLDTTSDTDNKNKINESEILISYIKNDSTDKSLQNIRTLQESGNKFRRMNRYYANISLKEHIDTVTKTKYWQYIPHIDFFEAQAFLKPKRRKGLIEGYIINFKIDSLGNIVSKKTKIEYSKAGVIEYDNNKVPDVSKLINYKEIERHQNVLIAQEKHKKNLEHFEDECIFSGRCLNLMSYVKYNMHDPSSFEHLYTTYVLNGDYAVVKMAFKGKNLFNVTVVNTVVAKVRIKDCAVISCNYIK